MPAHRSTHRGRKAPGGRRKSNPETFGSRLKAARLAADMAADEVAKKMGVALSTYYSWESDERSPREVVALASVVRSSVGALYGERAA